MVISTVSIIRRNEPGLTARVPLTDMPTEIARPIPGWKPTTPDIGRESLESLFDEHSALAIHFWAPWNGVDPLMDRGIQQIANQFANRVTFFSVNVDTERGVELAQRFGVATVPTLVMLRSNSPPRLAVGYGRLRNWLISSNQCCLAPKPQPRWAFWRRTGDSNQWRL